MAGRVAHRYGSKAALIAGAAVSAAAFGYAVVAHRHPYEMLISAFLLGVGIGLAFSALGNLIVQAVPPTQTGVATGMNTVMRTLGGALGGQLAATFVANNTAHGLPTVTGFVDSYVMATAFLVVCVLSGLLVPWMGQVDQRTTRAPEEERDSLEAVMPHGAPAPAGPGR
jgi:MFS family permease